MYVKFKEQTKMLCNLQDAAKVEFSFNAKIPLQFHLWHVW